MFNSLTALLPLYLIFPNMLSCRNARYQMNMYNRHLRKDKRPECHVMFQKTYLHRNQVTPPRVYDGGALRAFKRRPLSFPAWLNRKDVLFKGKLQWMWKLVPDASDLQHVLFQEDRQT